MFMFHNFSRQSYLTRCRGSKFTLSHRVKERKTASLSAQASFAPFSLKVAWSGKSLISQHFKIENDYMLINGSKPRVPTDDDIEESIMHDKPVNHGS